MSIEKFTNSDGREVFIINPVIFGPALVKAIRLFDSPVDGIKLLRECHNGYSLCEARDLVMELRK